MDVQAGFSRSLSALRETGTLHFAAHSHHLWPDVTYEAHQRAWEHAASLADHKWGHVFGELLPALQRRVAGVLSLPDPRSLCFAPNTHELLKRVLSCLDARPPRILTTGSEFHSLERQLNRLEEDRLVEVTRVDTRPFEDFEQRFGAAIDEGRWDLVFLSQVFFDSGRAVRDLDALVARVRRPGTFVVLDGYHGFMARPTDLSACAGRAFYLSGGYKYAMGGEGVCFKHAPPGYGERPRDTGWFAAFSDLARERDGTVSYATDGQRFAGATFDPTPLYRQEAVLAWLEREGASVAEIHAHAVRLMRRFVDGPVAARLGELLVAPGDGGNFLCFDSPDAERLEAGLKREGVVIDPRGRRLRFGFGLYHAVSDVDELLARVRRALD